MTALGLSWLRGGGKPPALRTVEVESPSAFDEGSWVFLAAAFVCLCVIYVVAFQTFGRSAREAGISTMLPYQTLFRDLPGGEQRVLRAMLEGVSEAVAERDADGAWPSPDALAGAGIPPFAPDPLDRAKLQWSERRAPFSVDYVGAASAGSDATLYLVAVREPEPGGSERPVPGVLDEEHRALADGTLVHVTFWKRATGAPPAQLVADPALLGWTQIRVEKPFISLEEP
ncbi:MAG: hypothetical protein ABI629_17580 [bacterium]